MTLTSSQLFEDNSRVTPYTDEDDARIVEAMEAMRSRGDTEAVFMVLADQLGRSASAIKNRYYTKLKPSTEDTGFVEDTRSIISNIRGIVKERDKLREEVRSLKKELEEIKGSDRDIKALRRDYSKLLMELRSLVGEEDSTAPQTWSRSVGESATTVSRPQWSEDDKSKLADIIILEVTEGHTMSQAFEQACLDLGRTSQACAWMWHQNVSRNPEVARRVEQARNKRRNDNEDDRREELSDHRRSS